MLVSVARFDRICVSMDHTLSTGKCAIGVQELVVDPAMHRIHVLHVNHLAITNDFVYVSEAHTVRLDH